MKSRAPRIRGQHAFLFLILATLSIGFTAGCSFQNPLRGFFSRAGEIPVPDNSELWVGYQEAMENSLGTGKPVMLFFTGSDWCKWCVKLQDEVFNTDEFREWAAQNVIMVEVDFPQGVQLPGSQRMLNETLKKTYEDRIEGYPTALFIDSQGNVIGKLGYVSGGPKPWIEKASPFVNSVTM